MLRDDAIRLGYIEPTEEDIDRMHLDRKHLPKRAVPPPKEATPEDMLDKRKEELAKFPYKALVTASKALGVEIDPSLRKEEIVELLATGLSPDRYMEILGLLNTK